MRDERDSRYCTGKRGLGKMRSEAERSVFLLRVRAEPGVDEIAALRAALKWLLRRCGLRCLGCSREAAP
jgi:hypothetical protein